MQVKPRFKTYKILESHPFYKDDTGNVFAVTLFEVTLPDSEQEIIQTTYTFWAFVGQRQEQWQNKSISYENNAYWKSPKKENLLVFDYKHLHIEEVENGIHGLFNATDANNIGVGAKTKFIISINNK